jgi:hypothetical protein
MTQEPSTTTSTFPSTCASTITVFVDVNVDVDVHVDVDGFFIVAWNKFTVWVNPILFSALGRKDA